MHNHKRTETAARLKKIYSSVTQAIKLAETEQGAPISEWGNTWGNADIVHYVHYDEYSVKYSALFIFHNYLDKYLPLNYKSPCTGNNDTSFCDILLEFNDGSQIIAISEMYTSSSSANPSTDDKPNNFYFTVDVNGAKGPNRIGSDRFKFYLNLKENPKVLLAGALISDSETYTREELIKKAKSNSDYCLDVIMNDGWEIKSDYPYKI